MKAAIIGLALGLVIGGLNQYILLWAVGRVGSQKSAGIVARFLGGCAVRLMLDALALFLAWWVTGHPRGRAAFGPIVGAVTGLLVATGVFTVWQYRAARQGRRRVAREVRWKR